MPGLVDAHVHVNEPGRTEWEGFAHATRAAAAGGVTTIADMPLNSDPVTISARRARARSSAAAEGQCWVDVGFHAGLVPANAARRDQSSTLDARGVLAWKAFLCDSGLADFPRRGARPTSKQRCRCWPRRAPGSSFMRSSPTAARSPPPAIRRYRDWEASRPPEWELQAIAAPDRALPHHRLRGPRRPSRRPPTRCRCCDRRAPKDCRITVETCPHYLHFAAEDIPDGDARYKCAPPIRGARESRSAVGRARRRHHRSGGERSLARAARDESRRPTGTSRAPGAASRRSSSRCRWSGPARWRAASRSSASRDWLCARPAELLGLDHDRGAVAAGKLASLVAWDPEASFVVDPARLLFRHPSTTPYAGERLHGVVERTWLRGREVARGGEILGAPTGRLRRARAPTHRRGHRRRSLRRAAATVTRCAYAICSRAAARRAPGSTRCWTALTSRDRRLTALHAGGAGLRPARPRGLARSIRRPPAHRRPRQPAPPVCSDVRRSLPPSRLAPARPRIECCARSPRATPTTNGASVTSSSCAPPARAPTRCSRSSTSD